MSKDEKTWRRGPLPRGGDADKPTVLIAVRVTEDEKKDFEASAKEKKLSLSEWIRTTLRRAAGLKPKLPPPTKED